ncbi:retrovirus-related pol polyprotein from transposon TNT 1-94 [Tanacetum coccineum]
MKSKKWRQAMEEEIKSIEKNDTWELTTLPKGQKAIGVKWVYKAKKNAKGEIEKYKARLIAKGGKSTKWIPVKRSGDGKPSVGSNSQSVSINENAVLGNKSVDMSGKYGTSYAGAESVGVSDCNKVYKEADFIPEESMCLDRPVWDLPLCIMAPEVYKKLVVGWVSSVFYGYWLSDGPIDSWEVIALKRLHVAPPSYSPGDDVNIAVESSWFSWID